MSISESIQKIIQDNLPETVAKELKVYLVDAASTKDELDLLKKSHKRVVESLEELRVLELSKREIDQERKELQERKVQLDQKEALLKLREDHAKERVNEIKNLTETVFRSNRMSYNFDVGLPNPNYGHRDQYGSQDMNQHIHCHGTATKDDS